MLYVCVCVCVCVYVCVPSCVFAFSCVSLVCASPSVVCFNQDALTHCPLYLNATLVLVIRGELTANRVRASDHQYNETNHCFHDVSVCSVGNGKLVQNMQ